MGEDEFWVVSAEEDDDEVVESTKEEEEINFVHTPGLLATHFSVGLLQLFIQDSKHCNAKGQSIYFSCDFSHINPVDSVQ